MSVHMFASIVLLDKFEVLISDKKYSFSSYIHVVYYCFPYSSVVVVFGK